MATKPPTDDADKPEPSARESAQEVWLAGLGAFAQAQQQGSKYYESLIREGLEIQRKTQVAAQERLQQATAQMASMAAASGVPRLDKLEGIFETRVARALERLGLPSADEVAALRARVEALEQALGAAAAPKASAAAKGARTPPKAAPKAASPARKRG